jgi:AraC-like DNA-binding protein
MQSAHRWTFIREGCGTLEGPDGDRAWGPGDLLLVPAGVRHRILVDPAGPMDGVLLRLRWRALSPSQSVDASAAEILRAVTALARQRKCVLRLGQATESVGEHMEAMCRLSRRGRSGFLLEMKAHLLAALAELGRRGVVRRLLDSPATPTVPLLRIRDVLEHLEDHSEDALPASEAAAMAGMSVSAFHTAFREATGTTYARYVTRLRVSKAGDLLSRTDEPIVQIAMACGFGSLSRFYEAFGRQMGTSPARFRNGTSRS